MEIGSITQFQSSLHPIGMANSLSAINNSSVQNSQTVQNAAPSRAAAADADTYEPGLANATAYAGLYAPMPLMGAETTLGIGGGVSAEADKTWSEDEEEDSAALDGRSGGTGSASGPEAAEDGENEDSAAPAGEAAGETGLSEEEQALVDELKATDREVRQHEQAHMSAGGAYAGAASYTYERGPDGQNYAVGGEVSIDVSAESDPEATIAKMRTVRAAALAPANPSGQDMSVAAQAQQQELKAQQDLRRQEAEEAEGGDEGEAASGVGAAESAGAAGAEGESSGGAAADVGGFAGRAASAYASMSSPQPSGRGIDLVA